MKRIGARAIIGGILLVFVATAVTIWLRGPQHQGSCGSPKLASTLSANAVDWDQFGLESSDLELGTIRDRSWEYMPLSGCESTYLGPDSCETCLVAGVRVTTAPSADAVDGVVGADSSHENFYPVSQVSDQHWEEVIPGKFIDPDGTMFSWTKSGCRYISVRWLLSRSGYGERADREQRAAAFLNSLEDDGC